MIPKKIHYCWFGKKPLPESAIKCIASWKKFFPDYEIIEWNENNYDVTKIPYIKQAYEAKKYAFVSDYARFDILYQYGGVYFDTDVEVIKSFDDVLVEGAFIGCEIDDSVYLNPGLGIAAAPGLQLYKEIIDSYAVQNFLNDDGITNTETVVAKTTRIFFEHGLRDIKGIQKLEDVTIYPKEYFNPMNSNTGKIEITENTYSIHWYTMSWMSPKQKIRSKITRPIHRILGEDCFAFLRRK